MFEKTETEVTVNHFRSASKMVRWNSDVFHLIITKGKFLYHLSLILFYMSFSHLACLWLTIDERRRHISSLKTLQWMASVSIKYLKNVTVVAPNTISNFNIYVEKFNLYSMDITWTLALTCPNLVEFSNQIFEY